MPIWIGRDNRHVPEPILGYSSVAMTTRDRVLSTEGGGACPVCEAPVQLRIGFADYQLFACGRCGCWSSDALARGASISFEPENYFGNPDADRDKWEVLWNRLSQGVTEVRAALDVGCGNGAYLAFLRERLADDARLEGIELDPGRAAESRRRDPSARIHHGDALEMLAHVGRPFDLVTLWDVFEHVAAPRRLLIELAQVLTPGGVIYLQTIHERSIVPVLGRLGYWVSGGRFEFMARRTHEAHHLVFFTRKGLDEMAKAAGLRIRELWFGRLARSRMDGGELLTSAASLLLALENRLGNGLFINLILERRGP